MNDQYIINHLDAWIAREFDGLAINESVMPDREAMLALVAADSDYLDRGWWRVYDAVRSC
jgi:hypothetical protein